MRCLEINNALLAYAAFHRMRASIVFAVVIFPFAETLIVVHFHLSLALPVRICFLGCKRSLVSERDFVPVSVRSSAASRGC